MMLSITAIIIITGCIAIINLYPYEACYDICPLDCHRLYYYGKEKLLGYVSIAQVPPMLFLLEDIFLLPLSI